MTLIKSRKALLALLLAAAILAAASLSIYNTRTYAALPNLDTIRVALYIETRGTVPSVTISSQELIQIGIRKPNGYTNWLATSRAFRAGLSQYRVWVAETADFTVAKALYDALDGARLQPYIFKTLKKNKTFYNVYTGNYATQEEAQTTRKQIAGLGIVAKLQTKPAITGPLFWNAGTYESELEATQQIAQLGNNGIAASLVYHENADGRVVYSVWLGQAVDQSQLEAVKAEAANLMPNLQLQPTDPDIPFLLQQDDVSLTSVGSDGMAHYSFNGNGQKVTISANQAVIKVHERNGRSYRGQLELSKYKNKLAVINELPLEHYLYSVVGSEMGDGWPIEALKAQAVAARTYALKSGMKYQIANVSDTTFDQAYYGASKESATIRAAIDATAGVVLVGKNGLITPLYSSNMGGFTADPLEVWGNSAEYLKSVPSPDGDAQIGKLTWHRIVLPNGISGYIRADFVAPTGEFNSAGLPYYVSTGSNINVRPSPYVPAAPNENDPLTKVQLGDRFISLGETVESNAYSWIRGPYKHQQLLQAMNALLSVPIQGRLEKLEIAEKGVSKRVTKVKANGNILSVAYPDAFRSLFNGLPSTRFDIEETGRYTILGAGGSRTLSADTSPLYVVDENSSAAAGEHSLSGNEYILMNAQNEVRVVTKEPAFRFIGYGFGHGLGMSQWGARAWADLGYDYIQILQYYYDGVSIVKE